MRYIHEIREGENVRDIYFCKQFQELKTKNGKPYYSILLQDKTGTLDAKVWDLGSGIEDFDVMDFIQVEGLVTSFQGSLQLSIRRLRKASEGEYDVADYMPVSDKSTEDMFKEFMRILGKVKNPYLVKLLNMFFVEDKELVNRFKSASAAKAVHHAFVGGLLEHILGVLKLCDIYSDMYPILNKDLLLTAAALHDIGKTVEISAFPENDYTDEGNLLGHIFIGAEKIGECVKQIDGFPRVLENELKHCILAHHGELEYGSPKKPALAEAFALYFADNLDAKMETLKEIFNNAPLEKGWLGYQKLFESNIRKTSSDN